MLTPLPSALQITVLGSGSRGNCALIEGGGTRILVDAGIALPDLLQRMRVAAAAGAVDHIVLTHAHGDHHRHAVDLAHHFGAVVWLTESVRRCVRVESLRDVRVFSAREPFTLDAVRVRPCSIPHDAPQVALRFEHADDSAVIATDLGEVPEALVTLLRGARVALLESNHDEAMLQTGPYSRALKRRVAGARGHLSNAQTHALLRALDPSVETVVLMHLSETNNRPELARDVAAAALCDHPAALLVASQRAPLRVPRAMPVQGRLF